MFKVENISININFKSYLKRYKLALSFSFIVGSMIGSIPFISKINESFKVQKLIEENKKIQIQNKAKLCKKENSEYDKFLNLGFPKTAIEKFNFCMKNK